MADPSRTRFADYLPKAPACHYCGRPVTLKQAHRMELDCRTNVGRVYHAACQPYTVRVTVEAA